MQALLWACMLADGRMRYAYLSPHKPGDNPHANSRAFVPEYDDPGTRSTYTISFHAGYPIVTHATHGSPNAHSQSDRSNCAVRRCTKCRLERENEQQGHVRPRFAGCGARRKAGNHGNADWRFRAILPDRTQRCSEALSA
jgi:hypothetical protein